MTDRLFDLFLFGLALLPLALAAILQSPWCLLGYIPVVLVFGL